MHITMQAVVPDEDDENKMAQMHHEQVNGGVQLEFLRKDAKERENYWRQDRQPKEGEDREFIEGEKQIDSLLEQTEEKVRSIRLFIADKRNKGISEELYQAVEEIAAGTRQLAQATKEAFYKPDLTKDYLLAQSLVSMSPILTHLNDDLRKFFDPRRLPNYEGEDRVRATYVSDRRRFSKDSMIVQSYYDFASNYIERDIKNIYKPKLDNLIEHLV